MSEPAKTTPQTFPCEFRDALQFIPCRTISARLERVRRFITWQKRIKFSAIPIERQAQLIRDTFLARQRQPFRAPDDLEQFASEFLRWWTDIELPRIRRTARYGNREPGIEAEKIG